MKKALGLVLVLSLFIPAFLSAGGQQDQDASKTEKEQVELEWWTVQAGEGSVISWMDQAIEGFTAEHPEVSIKTTHMSDEDFKVSLKSAMAAGIPPAIWRSWGGGVLRSYVDEGQVADLTEMIAKKGDLVSKSTLGAATFDGKNYALPYTSWAGHVYINEELFEKAGVEVPDVTKDETWSWTELKSAIEKFKAADIIPFAVGGKEKWELSFYYMYLVDRFGGSDYFAKTLAREEGYSFTDGPFVKAGEKIDGLVDLGAFQKGFAGAGYLDAQRYFFTEKAAMYLMGTWLIGDLRDQAPDMKLNIIRFPEVPQGKGDPSNVIGAPQTFFAVSENIDDANKEVAKKFVDYLATEDVITDFVNTVGDMIVFNIDLPENAYDPVIEKVIAEVGKAGHMQMAYDQYSPPEFASVHLDNVAALFSQVKSPQEVAEAQEKSAEKLERDGVLPQ